jgi:arginine deiminase
VTSPDVSSEIGKLKQVLVHRPGVAIARLTPENKEALLFDDLLWVSRAQREHDDFVAMMEERGTEVLYFDKLLGEVLDDAGARDEVLRLAFNPAQCGPHVATELVSALADAPTRAVVDLLIGGIMHRELVDWDVESVFADLMADSLAYVLRPLPNLLFMRDNAAWIRGGLCMNVLATPARSRESEYMRMIYRHHPRFRDVRFPVWFGKEPGDAYPATIEGGDVLVLTDDTLMVGIGERTAPAAVEILAQRLFAQSTIRRVIAVHLKRDRSVMHLDTVFTMVDVDKFNVFPGMLERVDVHVITPGMGPRLQVEHVHDLATSLYDTFERADLVFIPTGGDAIGMLREQWDDGNNTLALEPGLVVAYTRNVETNRRLVDAGVEVLELDSSELCRGRGGSRCMTQPIVREPVPR